MDMAARKKVRTIPRKKRPGPRPIPGREPKETSVTIDCSRKQKDALYKASDVAGKSFASWALRILTDAAAL